MARPQLTIVAGEVIEVQLSSDKLDLHGASRATGLHGARIISSMRVFVRDDRGAEDNFDFDGADMGVRQGHRIVIALGADAKIPEPIPLALINVSTGEREEFLRNFALFTERPPRFGPRIKAAGSTILFLALAYGAGRLFIPQATPGEVLFWSVILSFLAYPTFWAMTWGWDALTRRLRAERERNAIRSEIEGSLAARISAPAGEAA